MTSLRRVFLALLLISVVAPLAWPYAYFGRYNTAVTPNTLIPIRYDVSKLPNSTITFYLTDEKPQAMAASDSVEALMSEISTAASLWNSVPTSSLRVNFGGYYKSTTAVLSNPIGLVTFTNSLPPGAAAVGGPLSVLASSGNPPAFFPIGASRVQLPTDMSRTNTSSAGFLTIITHEMGHSLGTKHSHVNAVMFQSVLTTRARILTEDDAALISLLYPAPSFATSTGSISGKVTTAAGQGASVVAVSAYSDTAVVGALTLPDGTFTIQGLPPGNYKLMVQPLMLGAVPSTSADNPGDPDDLIDSRTLTNAVVSINTDIDSAFFAGGGAATHDPAAAATFPANAGQTTPGANIIIGARGPLRMEVNGTRTVASSTSPNISRSPGLVFVTRGSSASGLSDGKGLGTGTSVSFTNQGLSLVAGSINAFTSGATIFSTAVTYTIQASAGATTGSSTLIYSNGSDNYFSPGQVRVVATGPPTISNVSPSSGGIGTALTITGSNFTGSSQVYLDGMLVNTTSSSPTSLVVVAPAATGGHPASVFVANADGQGSEFGAAPPTFTYAATPPTAVSLSPAAAVPGQALTVRITGTNTNFQQGLTAIGFGSGDVVVDSVTVDNPTSLSARIHVTTSVSSAKYSFTVVTGEEVVYLPDSFSLTTQGPFTLQPLSGLTQLAAAGATLPRPLVVVATDANGVPISGVSVTFAATVGGGSVTPTTATTDSNGLAQTQMTLGPAAGLQVVTASANQFASTAFIEGAGSLSSIFSLAYARGGDAQTGTAGNALANPLTMTVVDSGGTPLPGIPIGWLVVTGGGSIRPSAAVTDSTGKVSAIWTLGPVAGAQSVKATPFFYGGVSQLGYTGATFTATAQPGTGPAPVINGTILNGAGFDSSVPGLSPGAIASIFGTNLSTATSGVEPGLVPGTTDLFTTSNGTRVTFDGVPAPLLYVSAVQLNIQVPFEVAGKTSAQVVVSVNGNNSAPATVQISPATPGLFTMASSGKGPAVVLLQDGLTKNSAATPAPAGSVIQLYATGLGAVSPAVATGHGAPTSLPLALSVVNPTVTIGGLQANVEFSGLSPGFIGLWQVNVRVPSGVGTGEVQLLLNAGGQRANAVTLFLK